MGVHTVGDKIYCVHEAPSAEIIAEDVQFLSRPRQSGAGGASEPHGDLDEDVPF